MKVKYVEFCFPGLIAVNYGWNYCLMFCQHLCTASSGVFLPAVRWSQWSGFVPLEQSVFKTVVGGGELDSNLTNAVILEVHLATAVATANVGGALFCNWALVHRQSVWGDWASRCLCCCWWCWLVCIWIFFDTCSKCM